MFQTNGDLGIVEQPDPSGGRHGNLTAGHDGRLCGHGGQTQLLAFGASRWLRAS
jgi:hypothetical protein